MAGTLMKPVPLSALLVLIATLILFSMAFSSPGETAPGHGPGPKEDRTARFMNTYDLDGDGKLDEREQALVRRDFRRRYEKNPYFVGRFDRNGNGIMDEAEWELVRLDRGNARP